ncbi:hypothetical protein PLICRDRAFT_169456 [Plicaturopsis crispa FD-325 SS-3]|nr:hypothetical protein PLICRDRAFT_169456 [Plicaturopsis crispa FD-325 SS-3]
MAHRYQALKDSDLPDDPPPIRRTRSRRLVHVGFLALFGLVAVLSGAFYARSKNNHFPHPPPLASESHGFLEETLTQCPSNFAPSASPPAPVNIWAPLTVAETAEIHSWISQDAQAFNLTSAGQSDLSDNVIFLVEALPPPKDAALAYLDSPKAVSPPDRYAHVAIHHGAGFNGGPPVIKDWRVGPLPISAKTRIEERSDVYHREIPHNARGVLGQPEFTQFLAGVLPQLKDVMQDLFNGSISGTANDTLIAGTSAPFGIDGSFRRLWITFRRNKAGPWLHPVNFFIYLDISGTDRSLWRVIKLVYNHQIFATVDDLLTAYKNNTIVRLPPRPDQSAEDPWSTRVRPEGAKQRDLDNLPGPRAVSFGGLRFRIDQATKYVSWMGWGMYLGFNRDMGMNIWDLRFRGERIIYQLAPQEAIAQYAGNDPGQTTTAWLDSYFGMGTSVRSLLPSYDCPAEAVFLPATTSTYSGSTTIKRAICVFEHDTGRPLTRHTGWIKGEWGAVRGYVLVIRSISTVGNLMTDSREFDYMFHLDGTIEVRLSASGYLQGGFWEPKQSGYGTPIRDTTMGSLHDHVINYKVDFDIAGTRNSLLSTTTSQESVMQPWHEDDEWGPEVIQQKITRKFIENEDDALLKYPANFQGGYSIVNQEETNTWGTPRGYAIHPGYSPIHNSVVGSKRLLNNANWARYNLAVSKRKETEPSSSCMWNLHLPGKPAVDFHNFFDGENITQEDLVAWVNIGMHHIPQAEDSPNTRTNTATSSFFLTPLNFFDSDISLDSTNAILLDPTPLADGSYAFNDYGVKHTHCVPDPPTPFHYEQEDQTPFDVNGRQATFGSVEDQRAAAEMYHRIKVEL